MCMNKLLLIAENLERPFIWVYLQMALSALLENDCSIRVYQLFVAFFQKIFPIMLALCLILSVTYYAQNYAGIIGWSLTTVQWIEKTY